MAAGLVLEALANLRRVQVRVGRLLQGAAECGAQQLCVLLPGVDLGGNVGVGRQIGFEHTAIALQELVIDVGMQIAFAGGQADHLSIRREGLAISPSLS